LQSRTRVMHVCGGRVEIIDMLTVCRVYLYIFDKRREACGFLVALACAMYIVQKRRYPTHIEVLS
jgi:hypothetical protein